MRAWLMLSLFFCLTAFAANAEACCCTGGNEPHPASCCGPASDDFQSGCDCELPCVTQAWSTQDMVIAGNSFPQPANHPTGDAIDTSASDIPHAAALDPPVNGPPAPLRTRLARLQVWRN